MLPFLSLLSLVILRTFAFPAQTIYSGALVAQPTGLIGNDVLGLMERQYQVGEVPYFPSNIASCGGKRAEHARVVLLLEERAGSL